MPNNYTTSTDAFADIAEGGYSTSDFPAMDGFVASASRLIDSEVGKWEGFFYPTTDTTVWYYDGSGDSIQYIDPFVSISEVAVSEQGGLASSDYVVRSSTDFITFPYNATNKGKPIYKLIADVWNANTNTIFYGYPKSVRVTGIAGYSATPPDKVALACRIQAVRWFMRGKNGYQDTGANANLGSMTITTRLHLDPDVKQLLAGYILELERND